MRKHPKITTTAACALLLPLCTQAADWQDLFNGNNLDGWQVRGGEATYEVRNGVIVGTAVPDTPNTFLTTEARYDNFIFEAEVKIDGTLNSGFMFRADSRPDYRNGVVYGYQAEIDPSRRAFSGGIYEEQRRGWLYVPTRNPECREKFKPGDWNTYRIEAIGKSIRTWVNGFPCARLIDRDIAEGFIGLQVHGVRNARNGQAGDTASWRKLRILTGNLDAARWPMPDEIVEVHYVPNTLSNWEKAQGWKLLWDGETTEGWRGAKIDGFPAKGWSIEDGQLIVEASGGGEARHGGDIITTEEFTEFEVQVDFKITGGANSGIKYFVDPDLLKGEGSAIGLEFQILDDERHPDAKQGVAGNRTMGSLYDLITAANLSEITRTGKRVNPPGSWNRARIVVKGRNVEHWLNDFKVVEYQRGTQMYRALVAYSKYAQWPNFGEWESGPILLQDHGDRVAFRSIKIRDLSSER